MLDSPALARAADANFLLHAGFVPERASGMRVVALEGVTLVDSALPCDTFNVIGGARLTSENADRVIRRAIAHFAEVRRPFSWWVGPADRPPDLPERLAAAGLLPSESELAMAADLEPGRVPPAPPSPALRIARARTAEDLRDFASINAANWNPPDPQVLAFYERAAPHVLGEESPLRFYVGRADGAPVAAVELAIGGGVAGLYNVATRDGFRRKGFGSAMTFHALAEACAAGIATAILQAAPDGVGIYRRAGFEEFGRIVEYKPGPAEGSAPA